MSLLTLNRCNSCRSLSSPERLAWLEIDQVVGVTTHGSVIRSVLDVGTGSGVFAEAFARVGLKVEGFDANRDEDISLNAISFWVGINARF